MKREMSLILLALMTIGFLSGCNKGVKFPRCYPTNVKVTRDGEPMEGMKISFYPKESIGNFSILAETDSSGRSY